MLNLEIHRDTAKKLGLYLAQIAKEKGIEQKEISENTGISETTISRIFTGEFPSKSEYLCCLAEYLGLTLGFS